MDMKTYKTLLDQKVTQEQYDELLAFATKRKVRKPDASLVKKSTTKNKGAECSDAECDRAATAKGMCSKHYTRAYRSDPTRREAARDASRRYNAKKKAAK